MAIDHKALFAVAIGEESTRGTAVAATAKLAGVDGAPISAGVEVWRGTDEARGTLAPAYMSVIGRVNPGVSLSGRATWEQLGNFLDAFFGKATPSGTGPYTRSYAAPLGAQPALTPWTVYYGSPSNAWRLTGGVANELTISATSGEPLSASLNMIGVGVESTTMPALAEPSATPIIHGGALYIDDFTGTVGTTQVTDVVFVDWELSLNANRANLFGVDAALAKDLVHQKMDGTLRVTLTVGPSSVGLLNALLTPGEVKRQVRIEHTSGTNSLKIDFAGALTEVGEIVQDQDGAATLQFTLSGEYCPALGNWLKIELVNDIATLP